MISFKKSLVFCFFATILAIILALIFRYRSDNMTCVFCKIVAKTASSEVIYEDETFVAFKDIKPAASFHFLIIPKKHIANVSSLTIADKEMVESMKRLMLQLLASNDQTDTNHISLGFHLPPFNSIKHLHLHGISPKSEIKFFGRLIFWEDSWWYKTVDSVINSLPGSTF